MIRIASFMAALLFAVPVCHDAHAQALPMQILQQRQDTDIVRAQELEAAQKYDEARAIYERLFRDDNTDIAYWRLILLYEKTGDYKAMETITRERLKRLPDDISAIRYLARAFYGQGDRAKGRQTLNDLIGGRWDDAGRVFVAANEFINQNEYDEAIALYIIARKRSGSEELFAEQLARLYTLKGEYVAALREYLIRPSVVEPAVQKVMQLVTDARDAGVDPGVIERMFAHHLDTYPQSVSAAAVYAELLLERKEYVKAFDIIAAPAAVAKLPDEAWKIASRIERANVPDSAAMVYYAFSRYFPDDPRRAEALIRSGELFTAEGDSARAADSFRTLAKSDAGTIQGERAALRLLELETQGKPYAETRSALDAFMHGASFRENAFEAGIRIVEYAIENGRLDDADDFLTLTKLKANGRSDSFRAAILEARTAFFGFDHERFAAAVKGVMHDDTGSADVNEILGWHVLGLRCSPEDMEAFNAYAAGMFALYRHDDAAADSAFVIASSDTASVVTPPAFAGRAELALAGGDAEMAVTLYLEGAGAAKDTALVAGMLDAAGDITWERLRNGDRAAELYRTALLEYPGSPYEGELRRKLRQVVER